MDLINEIRRNNGFDLEMLRRVERDPEVTRFREATLENLEQALKNLSEELYSKSTHFVFEFIQNADDNSYATNTVPTLRMRVEDHQVSFQCNEVGFTLENVQAICKVGASTKKSAHGYIGEKGIGFKSVFKVADVVFISSGPYTFKFDKREKLGMIMPIWTPGCPVSAEWTCFCLHLSEDGNKLAAHADDIKPSLLLFLRKLRSLTIEVALGNRPLKTIDIHRYETDHVDIVRLERIVNGHLVSSHNYLMIKRMIKTYTREPKRKDIRESEVVLAFPITKEGDPSIGMQDVHAFLPLRKYGFTFIIQADFLTSSSRENILADLQWNFTLRGGVIKAFLEAVHRFKQHPTLEYVWLRFLPNQISDPFFIAVENHIKQRLQEVPILRSTDGVYRLASEVITVPPRFGDDMNQPLIPECLLGPGIHYLSPKYDIDKDGSRLKDLGVGEMSDERFLQALKKMEGTFSQQSDTWHETVCSLLSKMLKRNRKLIQRLCIIPLSDGTWVSSNTTPLLFDLEVADVPNGLGLRMLKPGIRKCPGRYKLFEALGARSADAVLVACWILELHGKQGRTPASFLADARFMFAHRTLAGFPPPTNLRLLDEQGRPAKGNELYMDLPDFQSMRDILRGSIARFLHPSYLTALGDESKKDWWQWLQGSLCVNVAPRLIRGDLSPEFAEMTRTLESCKLLVVLKDFWVHLQGRLSQNAISQLSQTNVVCDNGTSLTLSATYIRRESLRQLDLPFLPIQSPNDTKWNFLEQFGVSTQVNGTYFIKRLIELQRLDCKDDDHIKGIYKQLDARFNDDPDGIRGAFQRESLIFAAHDRKPKNWMRISDVVWSALPGIMSKVALKDLYPFLEGFFRSKLRVNDPPPQDLLVNEVKLVANDWGNKPLPEIVKKQIVDILSGVSTLLRNNPEPFGWLELLCDEPIFPIDFPSGDTILCSANTCFYVTDHGKYEEMFRGHVPLLSPDMKMLRRIQSLLDSKICKPHIHFLEDSVEYSACISGLPVISDEFTEKYASRYEYIRRIVYYVHHLEPPPDALKCLTRLNKLMISSVDKIQSVFSLNGFQHRGTDDITIEEESDRLSIVISKTCPVSKWDLHICTKLEKLLEIPPRQLCSIILLPTEAVEDMFDQQGIPEIDAETIRDCSSVQDENDIADSSQATLVNDAESFEGCLLVDDTETISSPNTVTDGGAQETDIEQLQGFSSLQVADSPVQATSIGVPEMDLPMPDENTEGFPNYPTLTGIQDITYEPFQDFLSAQDTYTINSSDKITLAKLPDVETIFPPDQSWLHDTANASGSSRSKARRGVGDYHHHFDGETPQGFGDEDLWNDVPTAAPDRSEFSTASDRLPFGGRYNEELSQFSAYEKFRSGSSPPIERARSRGSSAPLTSASGWGSSPNLNIPSSATPGTGGGRQNKTFAEELNELPTMVTVSPKAPGLSRSISFTQPPPSPPPVNFAPQSASSTRITLPRKFGSPPTTSVDEEAISLDPNPQHHRSMLATGYQGQNGSSDEHLHGISTAVATMSGISVDPGRLQFGSFIQYGISESSHESPHFSLPENLKSMSALLTKRARLRKPTSQLTIAGFFPDGNTQYPGETPTTQYERDNGLLGEFFVYQILQRDLPGFGPENWTSELRPPVQGFSPYNNDALADFKYYDHQGVLTSLLYDEQKKEEWRDQWPTYYIEVKSTSSATEEVFHMSRRQLAISLNLTTRGLESIPEEVYVLFRVCEVRTPAPSLVVYVDPHRYFCNGVLQIVTDVEVVGEPSHPVPYSLAN